jgi:Bacterial Ig-like domain (group 3)
VIRIAARLLSALFVASLVSPTLGVGSVAASGSTDHFNVSGLPGSVTAGDPQTITIEARDSGDALDTTFAGMVSFTSSDGSADLPSDHQSLTNGSGTFQVTFKHAGPQTVTVTEDGDTPTGSQGTAVDPAAATDLAVSGYATTTTAGDSHSFDVTALDPYGNVDTNYAGTVTFTSNDGQADLPSPSTLTNGTDSFSATLKTAGTRSITAHDGGITGAQGSIHVDPAAADHIVLSAYPLTTQAGDPHTVTVTAKDQFGNVDTNDTDTATVTTTDSGDNVSPASHALVNGTWSFDVTFNTVGTFDINASAGAFSDGQSGITVDPGAATHFRFEGFGPTVTAGASDVVTVTAFDAADNVVTDYAGTVHITTTSALKVLPGDHTFNGGDSGVHMFVVTLNTAGTQ